MDKGHSFHFSLPEGLKLLSIGLENKVPYLGFGSYPKVPAITEEDWAAILRLVYVDRRRPEFYFAGFVERHPFEGRWFNRHGVEWMRGTSLGDLLLEVDWSMKCLQAGVRSDRNKNVFKAWNETSNLEGLADARDFPRDGLGSIYMTCEKVSVISDDASLTFDGEPKMRITDHSSSSYTNYITSHFDSVAYHDEPLFLKIREVVKLTVAAEWLRDREVPINIDWVMKKTAPSKRVNPEAALLPLNENTAIMKNALLAMETQPIEVRHRYLQPLFPFSFPLFPFEVRTEKAWMSVSRVDLSRPNRTVIFAERTYESNKRKETVVIKATVDDYDWLYKDTEFDPKLRLPVIEAGGFLPLHHTCQTLAELYKQTTPIPTSWLCGFPVPFGEICAPERFGGINLSNIPVSRATPAPATTKQSVSGKKNVRGRNQANGSAHLPVQQPVVSSTENKQYCRQGNTLKVSAIPRGVQNAKPAKPAQGVIPPLGVVKVPSADVGGSTERGRSRRHCLAASGAKTASGQTDHSTGSFQIHHSGTGEILKKAVSVRTRTEVQSKGKSGKKSEFGVILVNQPVDKENGSPIVDQRPAALAVRETASAAASDLMSPTETVDNGISSGISSQLGEPVPNPNEQSDGDSTVDLALDLDSSPIVDQRPAALAVRKTAKAAASDLMSPAESVDSGISSGISSQLGEPVPNPNELEEESDGDSSVDLALDLEASDSRDDR